MKLHLHSVVNTEHPDVNSQQNQFQNSLTTMITDNLPSLVNNSEMPQARAFTDISVKNVTVVVGSIAGISILSFIMIAALVSWHCCRTRANRAKMYCLNSMHKVEKCKISKLSMLPKRDSVVFLSLKPSQLYETCIIKSKPYLCENMSLSLKTQQSAMNNILSHKEVERNHSDPNKDEQINNHINENIDTVSDGLVNITNLMLWSYNTLKDSSPSSPLKKSINHCLSCNDLNLSTSPLNQLIVAEDNYVKKSQSLPSWGLQLRPASTGDEMEEIFSKLNFTKKRRNRMRNDSAAAIALNKSRSSLFQIDDKDLLVDNEVVVVYDERTAL